MESPSSRCEVIKGVAEVWLLFMSAVVSRKDLKDHRREFTLPQGTHLRPSTPPPTLLSTASLPAPPKKMSWTNANRPAPSSSTISYELGAYHLQKASCFHAPILIVFPARRPVARGRSRHLLEKVASARTCNACKWEKRPSNLSFRHGSKRTHSSVAKKCCCFFFS